MLDLELASLLLKTCVRLAIGRFLRVLQPYYGNQLQKQPKMIKILIPKKCFRNKVWRQGLKARFGISAFFSRNPQMEVVFSSQQVSKYYASTKKCLRRYPNISPSKKKNTELLTFEGKVRRQGLKTKFCFIIAQFFPKITNDCWRQKKTKNLQISLISVRNPQWFVQEYFSIFVPISSISCRNHQWFLQEKRHTFFQNFSIFSKNHQWFLEAKKQKIFKFRWFLSEIPNDLSRNIFPFSFRFHRFRAEITNDFCNQKTHIFSEFLDFRPKSPMIYVGKKIFFCEFFQNSSISCKNHYWFPQEKKFRKIRGFHSIGETLPHPPNP